MIRYLPLLLLPLLAACDEQGDRIRLKTECAFAVESAEQPLLPQS